MNTEVKTESLTSEERSFIEKYRQLNDDEKEQIKKIVFDDTENSKNRWLASDLHISRICSSFANQNRVLYNFDFET